MATCNIDFQSLSRTNINCRDKADGLLAMRRSRSCEASDHDEQDEIPLHHKRPFGAGLKRTKVEFVRAQDPDDYISTIPSTRPTSSVVGDLYASIVLGGSSTTKSKDKTGTAPENDGTEPATDSEAAAGGQLPQSPAVCPVCALAITTTTVEAHEASLAHQVSLAHSHPPSALDRSRMGLRALAAQGWDPDARVGLGRAGGEGTRYPIRATPKANVLGVGATVPEKTAAQAQAEEAAKEARRQLTAKERKARAVGERRRAARFQEEIYGRQDLDRYLKGDGKEWE